MREHGLQAPSRASHAPGPKAHAGTITPAAPDVMGGTDMTSTVTVGEGAARVFVAVDHCTPECLGLHVAQRGTGRFTSHQNSARSATSELTRNFCCLSS